jgi:hypothetical protein
MKDRSPTRLVTHVDFSNKEILGRVTANQIIELHGVQFPKIGIWEQGGTPELRIVKDGQVHGRTIFDVQMVDSPVRDLPPVELPNRRIIEKLLPSDHPDGPDQGPNNAA